MALKWTVAFSSDCPPDKKPMPGTAGGTVRRDCHGRMYVVQRGDDYGVQAIHRQQLTVVRKNGDIYLMNLGEQLPRSCYSPLLVAWW